MEKKIDSATLFSRDSFEKLSKLTQKRYVAYLNSDETITFSGSFDQLALKINLSLFNKDRSFYYEINTAMDLASNPPITPSDARDKVIDLIDQYLIEYFESGREVFLHIDWKTYTIEQYSIHMKGQILNKLAEDMADRILKEGSLPKQ